MSLSPIIYHPMNGVYVLVCTGLFQKRRLVWWRGDRLRLRRRGEASRGSGDSVNMAYCNDIGDVRSQRIGIRDLI